METCSFVRVKLAPPGRCFPPFSFWSDLEECIIIEGSRRARNEMMVVWSVQAFPDAREDWGKGRRGFAAKPTV